MQMGPRTDTTASQAPSQDPSQPAPTKDKISQEEIPVIEAEEPIKEPLKETEDETEKPSQKDKVDVKDIPF